MAKKLSIQTRNIAVTLVEAEIKTKVEGKAKVADLAPLFTAREELSAVDTDGTEKADKPAGRARGNRAGLPAKPNGSGDEATT